MDRPQPETVWRAIDLYLAHAYEGPPPKMVAARIEALRAVPKEQFYDCGSFERKADEDAERLSLRLGNSRYPHMKLAIEHAPGTEGYFFAADTHDQHALPEPGDADYEAFQALMQQNRTIAKSIESAWVAAGLVTFNQHLIAERERRRASLAARRGPQ